MPTDLLAVETFTLRNVYRAVFLIVDKCLRDQHLIGVAALGDRGKVHARIFRTNHPLLNGASAGVATELKLMDGSGGKLWVAEGKAAGELALPGAAIEYNRTEDGNTTADTA